MPVLGMIDRLLLQTFVITFVINTADRKYSCRVKDLTNSFIRPKCEKPRAICATLAEPHQ